MRKEIQIKDMSRLHTISESKTNLVHHSTLKLGQEAHLSTNQRPSHSTKRMIMLNFGGNRRHNLHKISAKRQITK